MQLVFLVLRLRAPAIRTGASLPADVLSLLATAGIAALSYTDHRHSLQPSTLLSLYLTFLVLLGVPRVRTLWLIGSVNLQAAILTTILILTLVVLSLEDVGKCSGVAKIEDSKAPEEVSGLWQRTSFTWLFVTFRAGYSKVLTQDDLPILDSRLRSHILRDQLVSTWAKCEFFFD